MDMTLDHLKGWIGREESASELLTSVLTERFLATFQPVEFLQSTVSD